MRLAESVQYKLGQMEQMRAFISSFRVIDGMNGVLNHINPSDREEWIAFLDEEIVSLRKELRDTREGDFWVNGPISELKVASENNWL
jgi:hypothetical protein